MLLKGALIKEGRLYNNFRIKGGAYWRGALIIGRALITVNTVYIIFILSVKELWKNYGREKFRTVKFSDTLLSELFLRPNFFVINVLQLFEYYFCY